MEPTSSICPASWKYSGLHVSWDWSCSLEKGHEGRHYDADANREWVS